MPAEDQNIYLADGRNLVCVTTEVIIPNVRCVRLEMDVLSSR